MTLDPRLAAGGNNPPDLLTVLAQDHAQLLLELDKLADCCNAQPKKIKTQADLDFVTGIVKSARALSNRIENARKSAKDPFLTAERQVDQFFKSTFSERLDRITATFQGLADDYAREQKEAARRAAQAEAERFREEEQRRIAAAHKAEEAGRLMAAGTHAAKAATAASAAEQAEAQAKAGAADLVRAQTAFGTVTGRDKWTYRVIDYDSIDLEPLRPYFNRDDVEKAIRLFVRQGGRKLASVEIFPDTKAVIR